MPEEHLQCLSLRSFGGSIISSCSMWLNPTSVPFLLSPPPQFLAQLLYYQQILLSPANFCKPNLTWHSYSRLHFSIVANHLNLAAGAHPRGCCCSPFPTFAGCSTCSYIPSLLCLCSRNGVAKTTLPHILTLLPNHWYLPRCRGLRQGWGLGLEVRTWDKARGQGCQA